MSRMAATTRRRSRRQFSDEFRAGAVRLVLEEGKTVGAVARELDLTESALRQWVERARADRSGGRTGLTTAEREELARLRKENRILAEERDILKKSDGLLREAEPGRFRVIAVEKARHTVIILCRCLAVTRSGFYAWQRRPESARSRDDRRVKVLVQASVDASKQRYGSPRIHEDLIEQDEQVSRKRVVRLMQEEGLVARARKRDKVTTMSDHDQPVAANLLDRPVRGGRPESAGGRRHDRVRHRQQR